MPFDINKLEKLSLSKNKDNKLDLTEEEINFMSNIYNTIINSEDYDAITEYLAGIYGMSISDIKLIRNVYFYSYATKEEKLEYTKRNRKIKKIKRKEGFIDISIMIDITISLTIIGISLGIILYNL